MLNSEQIEIIADHMKLSVIKVKACEMVSQGSTKYAAEKQYGLPVNTLSHPYKRFKIELAYLIKMGEAADK
jgi:hypothetical protein